MTRTEIITPQNASRLEQFQETLADSYIEAFAGEPWGERSRCDNETCSISFSKSDIGTACEQCGVVMGPAYTPEELYKEWNSKLENDDAIFELAINDEEEAVRATIAHPLTKDALFMKKYRSVPAMEGWIEQYLPHDLVWIDDTFANRHKSPTGNLRDRGITLARIALNYPTIDLIVTRTKAAEVVAATLRDVGPQTDLYIGDFPIDLRDPDIIAQARNIGSVPDQRTLLTMQTSTVLF